MKFLARLGEKLYLKHATQRESLDRLFRKHIGEREYVAGSEFDKMTDGEKQQIYLECYAFINNPVFQKVFQWELEAQCIDTMRSAENEFQFLVGKMSVYALENIKARFKLYANKMDKKEVEDFDRLSTM